MGRGWWQREAPGRSGCVRRLVVLPLLCGDDRAQAQGWTRLLLLGALGARGRQATDRRTGLSRHRRCAQAGARALRAGGDAAALVLWAQAERLGLRELIDAEVTTGGLAHSVGTYLQLIVCNRAHAPCAKLGLREWYEKTALGSVLRLPARDLDHRRIWDAMDQLPEAAIEQIQQRLCRRLVEAGRLGKDELLVFDPTNLYTFVASDNARNTIARRGHNKQKRHDLRQVGLALLTTRTHQLPLLHHVYAGDRPDAPTTRELAERLRRRFEAVLERAARVTVVYDRGAHSDELLTLFEPGEFHFVCGLRPTATASAWRSHAASWQNSTTCRAFRPSAARSQSPAAATRSCACARTTSPSARRTAFGRRSPRRCAN